MGTKLDVRDLRISFRTSGGRVKAVRDVNFSLNEGETLAIVGESGSGKSVTSKAILGILAGNSIVESGEILYDGMDLLKISEDDFYKIRGDKISMIFQDPLSSLNPIMRIGKQLTEAMLLKGKSNQRACRNAFNGYLARLSDEMVECLAKDDQNKAAELKEMCKNFDKFEFKHIELEQAFLIAKENAIESVDELENILFLIEKNALPNVSKIKEQSKNVLKSIHEYVVSGDDAIALKNAANRVKQKASAAFRNKDMNEVANDLKQIKEILEKALAKTEPNFFSMGYYLTFANKPLPDLSVEELNKELRIYLDDNYMLHFIDCVKETLKYSAAKHNNIKNNVILTLTKYLEEIVSDSNDSKHANEIYNELILFVEKSVDTLEIKNDSIAKTFASSLKNAIDIYYGADKKNAKELKRFNKEQAKYDKFIAKNGYSPNFKVVPAAIIDLEIAKSNIKKIMVRLIDHYKEVLLAESNRNYDDEAVAVIDFLKANASGYVHKVTRAMAKHRALKLMEEVGIPEPRRRYRQYPFEFSGGMRQRIVIAIALAADPDILICDEPTTALDVTIQAQILELINKLKVERKLSIIFITHDLGVVANMADKIAVMYAGKIVEYGTSNDVFYSPAHPYTWALLSSMPDLDTNEKLEAIPGTPPNMIYPPKGDAFADRNKYALKIDFEEQPPMFKISDTHSAATWLLHPDAPKVEPPTIVTQRIARMKERGASNEQ